MEDFLTDPGSSRHPWTLAYATWHPRNDTLVGASTTLPTHDESSSLGAVANSRADDTAHMHTNSVSRSFRDLDKADYMFYTFVLCATRTAAQQPINIALARKQVCEMANAQSVRQLILNIYKQEGKTRALLRGMPAMTAGCAFSEVLYLMLFEYSRENAPIQNSFYRDTVSGYVADASCRFIHIPLTVISYRQMIATMPRPCGSVTGARVTPPTSSPSHNSILCNRNTNHINSSVARGHTCTRAMPRPLSAYRTLQVMYGEGKLRTVFAGYGTTLAVGCQWTAIWWGIYGSLKAWLYTQSAPLLLPPQEPHNHSEDASTRQSAGTLSWLHRTLPRCCVAADDNVVLNSVTSVVTSAATALVFNPFLVLRTNVQVIPRATLMSAARSIYARSGVRGFYSGLGLNIGACILDGELASHSYEYAKLWADKTRSAERNAV